MTAAIVGVFLLHHFDASWDWYAAVIGMALFEGWFQDSFRKTMYERIAQIRISLYNLTQHHADEEDED